LRKFLLTTFLASLIAVNTPLQQSWAYGGLVQNSPTHQVVKTQINKAQATSVSDEYGVLIPYQSSLHPTLNQGNKTPLILIHGIAAEDDKYYHWARFLEFADQNPSFQKRFNVLLFRYDSTQSVPELSIKLQKALKAFIQETGGKQFRILAYSEGGLLTRNALQDPFINAHTEKVITVATPFHGSPLASPEWFKQQLTHDSILSPVRMTNRISYWVAKKKFPSFESDFKWDNFDQAMKEPSAVGNRSQKQQQDAKAYATAYSNKFITYGSYFGVDIDPDQKLPKALGIQETLPVEKPQLRNPFSKHFMFSLVRNNISKMPLEYLPWNWNKKEGTPVSPTTALVKSLPAPHAAAQTSEDPVSLAAVASTQKAPRSRDGFSQDMIPLMVYNDGISPITSSLWLGRFTPDIQQSNNPSNRLLQALKNLKGKPAARLFAGLDHRDWMDGSTRINSARVKDMLHPEEPSKTAFEWFIYDLMKDGSSATASTVSQVPSETKTTTQEASAF
jgi:pimeloyl-ACP methyl ester carboxylesterase